MHVTVLQLLTVTPPPPIFLESDSNYLELHGSCNSVLVLLNCLPVFITKAQYYNHNKIPRSSLPYIGFVNSHTKTNSCHDNRKLPLHPLCLICLPYVILQPSMIRPSWNTFSCQVSCNFFTTISCTRIYNPTAKLVLEMEKIMATEILSIF